MSGTVSANDRAALPRNPVSRGGRVSVRPASACLTKGTCHVPGQPPGRIVFEIDLADYEAERARLEGLGLRVTTAKHARVHWRSLHVNDPEASEVEWVCYDLCGLGTLLRIISWS